MKIHCVGIYGIHQKVVQNQRGKKRQTVGENSQEIQISKITYTNFKIADLVFQEFSGQFQQKKL